MPTLLLRLCGPMQSWGTRSRFTERDTEMEPSKSGVVGLLCAAMGWERARDTAPLAALRMGVRVEREGTLMRDYHTAGGAGDGVRRSSGSLSTTAVLSNRYYLADADFLVGLESSDTQFLSQIEAALRDPVWQLSLGRKSFALSLPPYLPDDGGLRDLPLKEALTNEGPLREPGADRKPPADTPRKRLIIETTFDTPQHELRIDQPLGAAFRDRTFGPRPILQSYLEVSQDVPEPASA